MGPRGSVLVSGVDDSIAQKRSISTLRPIDIRDYTGVLEHIVLVMVRITGLQEWPGNKRFSFELRRRFVFATVSGNALRLFVLETNEMSKIIAVYHNLAYLSSSKILTMTPY